MTQNETNLETNTLGGKQVNIASGKDVNYHRNGICGQPFWTIKFTYGDLNMIGTVGIEGDDLIASSCRVLCTGVVEDGVWNALVQSTWRGDQFAPFLAKQLNEIFAGETATGYLPKDFQVTLVEA